MTPFESIKASRVSDEIGAQIRRLVADGRLMPGDKLPAERDLALQLGVGRNAVREALRSLEIMGLVRLQKGAKGGATITDGDPSFLAVGLRDLLKLRAVTIEQITEARVDIEDAVTRIACEHATDEEIDGLAACVEAANADFERGDYAGKLAKLIEFHKLLARTTRNPVYMLVMASIMDLMHDFGTLAGPEANDLSIHALRKLIAKLRKRDAKGARAAMRDHLTRLKDRYVAQPRRAAAPGARS